MSVETEKIRVNKATVPNAAPLSLLLIDLISRTDSSASGCFV